MGVTRRWRSGIKDVPQRGNVLGRFQNTFSLHHLNGQLFAFTQKLSKNKTWSYFLQLFTLNCEIWTEFKFLPITPSKIMFLVSKKIVVKMPKGLFQQIQHTCHDRHHLLHAVFVHKKKEPCLKPLS